MAEKAQNMVEADVVSLAALKDLARRMLPPTSALRGLILSEPDYIPNEEVRIKGQGVFSAALP